MSVDRATWSLRIAVLAAGWCDLAAVHLAGGDVPLWLWTAVSCFGIAAAAWPGSLAPLLALGAMLGAWLAAPDGPASGWVLLGVAGVVTGHVAALVLDARPPGAAVPAALVRLWVRRSALVWLLSAALWTVSRLAAAPSDGMATSVRVSALLLLALGGVWLGLRLGTGRERGGA